MFYYFKKMKKYIILSVLIITSISCKAQTTYSLSNYDTSVLKNNNYIKDFDGILDKFVGIWKWTDSTNPNTYLVVFHPKKEFLTFAKNTT